MITTLFTFLTLFTTIFWLFYKYLTSDYNYWKKKGVDFITPKFPFGNFSDVLLLKTSIGEFMRDIYKASNENIVGFWIFGKPYALARSPELIKQILVADFNHFADRAVESNEKADPISAYLLLTMKNAEWKVTRQKVSPLFTTAKLKGMLPLVETSSQNLNNYIRNFEGVIETREMFAKFTTDVISSCAFGVEAGCLENVNSPFRAAGKKMLDPTIMNGFRFTSYFLVPKFVRLFKIALWDRNAVNFLKQAFWQTVELRQKSKQYRNDLIDKLIEMGEKVDIGAGIKFEGDRIVAQVIQFFTAGFETTSTTLSFILYSLSLHTDIQNKARAEIETIIKKNGGLPYEALMEMKYLDQIIYETLRLYPSLPFLDRKCVDNYRIPGTDTIIEKGTAVFISMLGLHYNPEYFPDPENFNPENFSEENIAKRPTFAYMPFGHGPHNCIGERFAMNSMKVGLSYILKDFHVERCPETFTKVNLNARSFALQPDSPMYLRFKKIQRH